MRDENENDTPRLVYSRTSFLLEARECGNLFLRPDNERGLLCEGSTVVNGPVSVASGLNKTRFRLVCHAFCRGAKVDEQSRNCL